jgi:hypothetical protein
MEAGVFGHTQSVRRKDRQSRLEAVAAKVGRDGHYPDVHSVEGDAPQAIKHLLIGSDRQYRSSALRAASNPLAPCSKPPPAVAVFAPVV